MNWHLVEPAAAALLLPRRLYVADLPALPEWPAEQLRLVVQRWRPNVAARIERSR
jgi:hypothetical protein